jgi:hypothetical protein
MVAALALSSRQITACALWSGWGQLQGQHDKHLEATFVSPEKIFFRSKTASICFSFIHYVLFVLYFVLCMQKETKMCV